MSFADELLTNLEENDESDRMMEKREQEPSFIPPNISKSVEDD